MQAQSSACFGCPLCTFVSFVVNGLKASTTEVHNVHEGGISSLHMPGPGCASVSANRKICQQRFAISAPSAAVLCGLCVL